MKVYLGGDHAGFELKKELIAFLEKKRFEVVDRGPFSFDSTDDYPDFVFLVADVVSREKGEVRGIVIGGSGNGETIVSNRLPNVRAISFYGGNTDIIRLGREHNDANILSLGARFIDTEEAKRAVEIFLQTEFSNDERHIRRIKKIDTPR